MGDSSTSESSSVWWSSWLSSAKEKSVSALNATKRDLVEFVSVLSTDTKSAVTGATANIKGALKSNSDGGSEGVDAAETSKANSSSEVTSTAPYDRSKAQLFAIQTSADTYLSDPKENVPEFDEWKTNFDVQACQTEISNLLVSCSHVRTLHAQLVPAQVSYEAFWMRYFFKVQQLEKEEERRAELMARASKRSEKQLQWDEETEEVASGSAPSPLLKLEPDNHHHRSGSSSDSFVCVSEETADRAPSQEVNDGESWVCLSEISQAIPQEVDDVDSSGVVEILDGELDNCSGSGSNGDRALGEDGKVTASPGVQDSGGSDWENWDD